MVFYFFICVLVNFSYCSLYFEVDKREKCFIEFIFANTSLMLKWDIYPHNKNFLNNDKFNQAVHF